MLSNETLISHHRNVDRPALSPADTTGDNRTMRSLWVGAFAPIATLAALQLSGGIAYGDTRDVPVSPSTLIATLLRDPTRAEWQALSRFDRTLTRDDFEARLDRVFDPGHGLRPFLHINKEEVAVFGGAGQSDQPLVVIRFAATSPLRRPGPAMFRSPAEFRLLRAVSRDRPLDGLRVVIDPADIGGRWAKWEDRSVDFRGFGRINEGDLNLLVARRLREELERLGASVFLVRNREEPVLPVAPEELLGAVENLLRGRPALVPVPFRRWLGGASSDERTALRTAARFFVTKTLETRARVALVRRSFQPDLTVVLQHDATPGSTEGHLTTINRNIFFVDGACLPDEMKDPQQRYRVLLKLLENVTPVETEVAVEIARRFKATTGFPPVLYGNSANTVLVVPDHPYVVARNLELNREHDGPVVVTEPYFMNQPDTLARLLAGDYAGNGQVAGAPRPSIFREYARCVAEGLVTAYGRPGPAAHGTAGPAGEIGSYP